MRELREDTFSGNKNDDAHEHVERVLDIVSLFNIPDVSHNSVMLCVFPITLNGAAKRWVDRLPLGTVDSCSSSEGIAAIVNKLENLGRDMKKLKENVYAILVGCQNYGGAHLYKDCPLKGYVKSVEKAKYGEFKRSSPFSNGAKYRVGLPGYYTRIDNHPSFGEKRPSLEELMNKHLEESTRRRTEMEEWKAANDISSSSVEQCKAMYIKEKTPINDRQHEISLFKGALGSNKGMGKGKAKGMLRNAMVVFIALILLG
ncbi:hypothetical protein Tco_0717620 [Tanacetum coccineum]